MGKLVLAVVAAITATIGATVAAFLLVFLGAIFGGTIVWILWNWLIVAEFAMLPHLSWGFCFAATWISKILLKSNNSATAKAK